MAGQSCDTVRGSSGRRPTLYLTDHSNSLASVTSCRSDAQPQRSARHNVPPLLQRDVLFRISAAEGPLPLGDLWRTYGAVDSATELSVGMMRNQSVGRLSLRYLEDS